MKLKIFKKLFWDKIYMTKNFIILVFNNKINIIKLSKQKYKLYKTIYKIWNKNENISSVKQYNNFLEITIDFNYLLILNNKNLNLINKFSFKLKKFIEYNNFIKFEFEKNFTMFFKVYNGNLINKISLDTLENDKILSFCEYDKFIKIKLKYYKIYYKNNWELVKFNDLNSQSKISHFHEYKLFIEIKINPHLYSLIYHKNNLKPIFSNNKSLISKFIPKIHFVYIEFNFNFYGSFYCIKSLNLIRFKGTGTNNYNILDFKETKEFLKIRFYNNFKIYDIKSLKELNIKLKNNKLTNISIFRSFWILKIFRNYNYIWSLKKFKIINHKIIKELAYFNEYKYFFVLKVHNNSYKFYKKNDFKIINFDGVTIKDEITNFYTNKKYWALKLNYSHYLLFNNINFNKIKINLEIDKLIINKQFLITTRGEYNKTIFDLNRNCLKIVKFDKINYKYITNITFYDYYLKIEYYYDEIYYYDLNKFKIIKLFI